MVVELPEELRSELKESMGPIFTDAEDLLGETSHPLVAVGDMVTYHLIQAGTVPDVALVDGKTERTAVEGSVRERTTGFDRDVEVTNPAATLTEDLLTALRDAIDRAGEVSTLLVVDGEEDLAVLPAFLGVPEGASVVYGQPGEGMVHVTVDGATAEKARDILSRMDGDTSRLWTVLSASQ